MSLEVQHRTTGHENQGLRGTAYTEKSFSCSDGWTHQVPKVWFG